RFGAVADLSPSSAGGQPEETATSLAVAEGETLTGGQTLLLAPSLRRLASTEDLRDWVGSGTRRRAGVLGRGGAQLLAGKVVPAHAALLSSDELVGEILLTFDRLLPIYTCAVEADPEPVLARHAGVDLADNRYTEADFRQATFLDEGWLGR